MLFDMKLLAECYNVTSGALNGKLLLYNITADPSESTDLLTDLSTSKPEVVAQLKARLLFYGAQAAKVAPLTDAPPWQGDDYFCAKCQVGRPQGAARKWEPWCSGAASVPCLESEEYI